MHLDTNLISLLFPCYILCINVRFSYTIITELLLKCHENLYLPELQTQNTTNHVPFSLKLKNLVFSGRCNRTQILYFQYGIDVTWTPF